MTAALSVGRYATPASISSALPATSSLRVTLAHDWLVQYAGSERVVEQMLHVFPEAQLLTTVCQPSALPARLGRAEPSFLQRIPGAAKHHEWLLPLMPLAWRLAGPIGDVDAVVSSSHACAKAIRVEPGIPHICYCHTPIRYAWDFDAEHERFPTVVRPFARALMGGFRRWDVRTAPRVTHFIANSTAVARRIRDFYGRDAHVIHPPVRTDFFTPGGERGDFFLYVGRLVAYKQAGLAVRAFAELPADRLVVVGRGHLEEELKRVATPNVSFIGSPTDEELRDLYRSARALVNPANEDFGIVMAEAQACGTPVIALAAGGAADVVSHGETGFLMETASVSVLRDTVRHLLSHEFESSVIVRQAQRFSTRRFREQLAGHIVGVIQSHRPALVP